MDKLVLGFSGGVDSSVSACLLRRAGFEVYCLYLDTCGSTEVAEVRAAAERLGFPLRVLDVRQAMEQHVLRPFAEGYLRGETPNPCILCNPAVKLRSLCDYADGLGARYIATGHYARSENGALYMGKPENDQSYMLCRIEREQLSRLVLPLGGYKKTEVRALAEQLFVPSAKKPDSMEICFIPDGDHAAWISARGDAPQAGNIIYNGEIVGRHAGIHGYTLGQRRHLGFAAGKRVYVSELRPLTNEIVLADGDGLFADSLQAAQMNWLVDAPETPFPCSLRIRHSKTAYPALVTPLPEGGISAVLEAPVRAPTRGQSAALYDGEKLLGGGFIL
ncbi:MAG: tRNA 2-thiouridine(34) synthase MnmA [Oscillospiraceae bacterium]